MLKNIKYLVILGVIVFVGYLFREGGNVGNSETVVPVEEVRDVINVQTIRVGEKIVEEENDELVGVVKAGTKIDVVSLGSGNASYVNFEVGDEMRANGILVKMTDMATLVNLNNARSSYENTKSNRDAALRMADESIRQAEINVESTKEAIESAKVALRSANTNYSNALVLQSKAGGDTAVNARTIYLNYKNYIKSTLDKIDYIIDVEDGGPKLTAIKNVLGIKNFDLVDEAEEKYLEAKDAYNSLLLIAVDEENIGEALSELVTTLNVLKDGVTAVNSVLDNTIASYDFSISDLSSQKTTYYALESEIISNINTALATLQGLENIPLRNKQEVDTYRSQIESARVQLDLANLRFDNALASLDSARQGKDQQLAATLSQVDASQGQMNLVQTQLSYLTIKAPISGTVIEKFVEVGTKINPGQKIASIAQTDFVKIVADVSSELIGEIKIGQSVIINDDLAGVINNISPSADAVTRKVKVEVLYDNGNNDLIPETFVNIQFNRVKGDDMVVGDIYIPLKSVVITQNEHYVYVLGRGDQSDDETREYATKVNVVLGEIKGDSVLIVRGLLVGDELVTNNVQLIKDGDEVKVANY